MKKFFSHPVFFLGLILSVLVLAAGIPSGHFPKKVVFSDGSIAIADMYGKQLFLKEQPNGGTFGKAHIYKDLNGKFIAYVTFASMWGPIDATLPANSEQICKWKEVFEDQ